MPTVFLRRVGNVLHADGDESVAELLKLPFGKSMRAEIKQPRNPAFHRLFFALCGRIAAGLGMDEVNAESIATLFKYATGHYTVIHSKTHGEIRIPKSISFAKMDNLAFREFFEKCVRVAYEEWQIPPESVADLLVPEEGHLR